MRRFITILIVIIIVVAVLVGGMWLIRRKTAVQNGEAAPSFREFLNFGTKTQPGSTPSGGLSSDFTNTENNTPTGTPQTTPDGQPITTSHFTSGPLSPTQDTSSGITRGDAIDDNSKGSPKPGAGSAGSNTGAPNATVAAAQQCSDADVSIAFTPEEIQKLNTLQNRFYAIAGTLHSDADVQTELANYDQFKAKSDQITELYNYCAATVGKIQNPALQNRITTPYWRDETLDGAGYYIHSVPSAGAGLLPINSGVYDPRDITPTQSVIERIFRVNLW